MRIGLPRNTVKKHLRAGEEVPRYARQMSSSKLDSYIRWYNEKRSRISLGSLSRLNTKSLGRTT